jgi:peptidyl-prolyl cis-trans isomerase SurA
LNRTRHFAIFVSALLASSAARTEIIDRIAVSVANRVITASDLDREIRVTAFLSGDKLDFSKDVRRAAAGRMVEQKLIERELETSRYSVPSPESIEPAIEDFKKKNFKSEQDYRRALAEYGLTEQDVREKVLWQRTLLKFLEVRFQTGVQVSDQEIEDYFNKVVAPAARVAHPGEQPAIDDYWDDIEEKLAGDRANQEMEKWLVEARKRTDIVYHEEVFQ